MFLIGGGGRAQVLQRGGSSKRNGTIGEGEPLFEKVLREDKASFFHSGLWKCVQLPH